VDKTLAIDLPRFASHVRSLLDDGCAMAATFGTTGEGASFSRRQKQVAHEALLQSGVSPRQLLPAVMSCAIDEAAAQLADIAALGCAYALVLPPFYYRQSPTEGIASYFEQVYLRAGSPALGVVLYNIPAMTGITISIELIERLKRGGLVPIAGVKDSTGDLQSGLAFARAFPELSIFTGDDRVLLPLVAAGGAGIIGGLPNLYSGDLAAMLRATDAAERDRLAELAAERIADIDRRGGLMALKADLAARLRDPDWLRALPPIGAVAAAP
jgi:4-hydroxy-tetrahydrodipicolinate synthase